MPHDECLNLERLLSLEQKMRDIETRLRMQEVNMTAANKDIEKLLEKMVELTGWIKILVITLIPTIVGLLGFLINNWVKGG